MLRNEKNVSTLVWQRKSLGLTQAEYAKKLGISRNYLALMETGKRPITDSAWDSVVTISMELETKSTNQIIENLEVKEGGAEYHPLKTQCRECWAKDAEISRLNRQVDILLRELEARLDRK